IILIQEGSNMLAAGLLFGSFICFGFPIGGAILLARRRRGAGKAFFMGVLAFIVSQPLLRLPLLQLVLPQYAWFAALPLSPWRYGLFLGVTAGLFEETARWTAIRFCLKDKTNIEHGLAFGLGHGGAEAILFAGIRFVSMLFLLLTGKGALLSVSAKTVCISSLERLSAIMFHIGASLLVMHGVRRKKARYLAAAILLHTLLDAPIVILPIVFGAGIAEMETYAALTAACTLLIGIRCFGKNTEEHIE
ncbi:MAG: YhfC family intramembrane metalloprotease, partial [Lachnospiraceae bacterium]|nr:YhfC family intramembrane metalloprotease [Lachnospiraceae bacterium]